MRRREIKYLFSTGICRRRNSNTPSRPKSLSVYYQKSSTRSIPALTVKRGKVVFCRAFCDIAVALIYVKICFGWEKIIRVTRFRGKTGDRFQVNPLSGFPSRQASQFTERFSFSGHKLTRQTCVWISIIESGRKPFILSLKYRISDRFTSKSPLTEYFLLQFYIFVLS